MRPWRARLTVRQLMVLVGLAALAFGVWAQWFDPVRRWQRAVEDDQNGARRWDALGRARNGKAGVDQATALATLTAASASPSRRVRETAIAGLGYYGPEARASVSVLLAALNDPDHEVRWRAAVALAGVVKGDEASIRVAAPALVKALSDRSWWVRLEAAATLAQIGQGEPAVPVLIAVLKRPEYMMTSHALWALGLIGPSAGPEALAAVRQFQAGLKKPVAENDPVESLPISVGLALYRMGDRDAGLAALRTVDTGSSAWLRREARRVLGELGETPVSDRQVAQ